jgi:hypothetical protein
MPAAKGTFWPIGLAIIIGVFVAFGLMVVDRPGYNGLVDWLQRNQSIIPIGLGMLGVVMIGLMVLSLYKMYAPRKPHTIPI